MNATDDFDAELRAVLRSRAEDIQAVPANLLPLQNPADLDGIDQLAGRRRDRRSHRTLLVAASVAAVLVVSGAVTALALQKGGPSRVASSTPPTTSKLAPTSTATCSAALPAQWRTAATSTPTPKGSDDIPLAVSPDGDALISRDTGTSRSAVLRKPDGSTTTLLALPPSSDLAIAYGALGKYAIVGLTRSPRGSNGAGNPLMRIEAIDPSSGKVLRKLQVMTEADYAANSRAVDTMAVQDGVIYWDERASFDARTGVVRSFDLADGNRKVVYRGPAVNVGVSAGGVYWAPRGSYDNVIHVPNPDVPQAVQAATTATARVTLSTDGTDWAWVDAAGKRIGYFDGARIAYLTGNALDLGPNPAVAVSGPYVLLPVFGQQRTRVLDTRTGSVITLPSFSVFIEGGGSVAVGSLSDEKVTALLDVDTATLPGLHC